jgi:hypothetical protein
MNEIKINLKVWMYYQSDGDSGYYNIKLFYTKEQAEAYKSKTRNAYGQIIATEVAEKYD